MSKNIEISFSVDGIGPHYGQKKISNSKFATSALNIALYAENGTGKTFISRMFALSENDKSEIDTARILSIGSNNGEFVFAVKNKDTNTLVHKYSVNMKKGATPNTKVEGKKFKYHVWIRLKYVVIYYKNTV